MKPQQFREMAAALAALAVLTAAGLVAGSRGGETAPEDVVRAYLAAVRRGDVAHALRIAGEPGAGDQATGSAAPDTSLLTAEAISGDWRVERIVRRYPWRSGPDAAVDVRLRTPEGLSADGRFWLVRDDEGRWSIEQPFVAVHIGTGMVDHVEINGVVRPPGGGPYLLFPGVYWGWTGLAERFADGRPPVMVALPSHLTQRLDPPSGLGPAGQAAAQRAVNAHLDECAKSTALQPRDCPFSGGDYDMVDVADDYYVDLAGLSWEVVTYPEVLAVPGFEEVQVVPRSVGSVRLTGTGTPSSGDRERFSVACSIDLTTLSLRLSATGEFTVGGGEAFRTC